MSRAATTAYDDGNGTMGRRAAGGEDTDRQIIRGSEHAIVGQVLFSEYN
jgi:hypothetical protein